MAAKAVVDAVLARMQAQWTACPVVPENAQGDTPADASAFIVVQFPVSSTERWSIGDRQYREEGGFRLVINVERGGGIDKLMEWGDQLAAIFRYRSFDGVECWTPTSPFTDDRSDEGNYFTGSVVVPYVFDFTDTD
jgi:hypothetical protein